MVCQSLRAYLLSFPRLIVSYPKAILAYVHSKVVAEVAMYTGPAPVDNTASHRVHVFGLTKLVREPLELLW